MAEIPYRLQAGTTFEESKPLINEAFNALDSENRTKVIKNGTTPTLLFGYQKGGFGTQDYGLKVAKPGFDVTTATPAQMAFNSGFNNLKVVGSGTIVVNHPANSVGGSAQITHNLGYIPAILAFMENSGNYFQLPNTGMNLSGVGAGTIDSHTSAYSNSTTATFGVSTPDYPSSNNFWRAYDTTIKYYLLQETAN